MNPLSAPLPTIRDELCHKTVEVLERLVHRAENHRLDRCDLALVGHALWNATSGLVTAEVSELASAVAGMGRQKPLKRHFVGKGAVRTIAWLPDGKGYAIVTRHADTGLTDKPITRDTDVGQREAELETLFASLRKAGYVEL
jgi:hypothetical protein